MSGDARYLISKGGAYYRPNAQGYTTSRAEAGRYTLAEAIRHSHPNGPDGPRDGITYELDDDPLTELQRLGQEYDARVGEEERARALLASELRAQGFDTIADDVQNSTNETYAVPKNIALRAMLAFASYNTGSVREEVLEEAAKAIEDFEEWGEWYGLDRNNSVALRTCTEAAARIRSLSSQDKKDGVAHGVR